jgi:single-stranded DNA-binding protein
MNSIVIMGARVVSEKSFTRNAGKNTVTKIRVVDNPGRKDDRNPGRFMNAEAWNQTGDQLKRLSKGDIVDLVGEILIDKYTSLEGVEKFDDLLKVTAFKVVKSESFFGKGEDAPPPKLLTQGPYRPT